MNAHVLTIGDEVLAGDIFDTNFKEIAERFRDRGILVTAHLTVPDDVDRIRDAVRASLDAADVVLCTGGLGPTSDDLTRLGVAAALGVSCSLRDDLVKHLEATYRSYTGTTEIPRSNYRQLELPEGAEPLPNPVGSAPGFRVATANSVLFSVPGVPREMRRMVDEQVIPWLEANRDLPMIETRVLRTLGMGESALADLLEPHMNRWRGVGVAFYPQTPGVNLKLTHHGKDARRIQRELDHAESEARRVLGSLVYGTGREELAEVVGRMLRDKGWRVAVAESCTGGLIASRITAVPGSSDYFDRGVVAYADSAKMDLLGVGGMLLEEHGAVSEPVARAMAEGLRARSGAEVTVATTGIAGPGGGTETKPVGLVYTAVAAPDGTRVWENRYPGSRSIVTRRTAVMALDRLRLVLQGEL